eukprot:gene5349-7421_t
MLSLLGFHSIYILSFVLLSLSADIKDASNNCIVFFGGTWLIESSSDIENDWLKLYDDFHIIIVDNMVYRPTSQEPYSILNRKSIRNKFSLLNYDFTDAAMLNSIAREVNASCNSIQGIISSLTKYHFQSIMDTNSNNCLHSNELLFCMNEVKNTISNMIITVMNTQSFNQAHTWLLLLLSKQSNLRDNYPHYCDLIMNETEQVFKSYHHNFSSIRLLRLGHIFGTLYNNPPTCSRTPSLDVDTLIRTSITHGTIVLDYRWFDQPLLYDLIPVRDIIHSIKIMILSFKTDPPKGIIHELPIKGTMFNIMELLSLLDHSLGPQFSYIKVNFTNNHDNFDDVSWPSPRDNHKIESHIIDYIITLKSYDAMVLDILWEESDGVSIEPVMSLDSCYVRLMPLPVPVKGMYIRNMSGNATYARQLNSFVPTGMMKLESIGSSSLKKFQHQFFIRYAENFNESDCYLTTDEEDPERLVFNTKDHKKPFYFTFSPKRSAFAIHLGSKYVSSNDNYHTNYYGIRLQRNLRPLFHFTISPAKCLGKGPHLPYLREDQSLRYIKRLKFPDESIAKNYSVRNTEILLAKSKLKNDLLSLHHLKVRLVESASASISSNDSLQGHTRLYTTRLLRQYHNKLDLSKGYKASHPVCDYDCRLLGVCIDTGKCRCHVPPICQNNRMHFITNKFSADNSNNNTHYFHSTIETEWRRVLTPQAQLFLASGLSERMKVHVLEFNETARTNLKMDGPETQSYEYMKKIKHVFIADHFTIKAFSSLQSPIQDAELILIPFYHGKYVHFQNIRPHIIMNQIIAHLKFMKHTFNKNVKFAMTFSHDYGACYSFHHSHFVYKSISQVELMRDKISLQPMGDYNTDCFYPNKDIVIPPVGFNLDNSMSIFQNPQTVLPSFQRPLLIFMKARETGTGFPSRQRVNINPSELFPLTYRRVTFIGEYPNATKSMEKDYMRTIGITKFCLCIRGTAGWSFRVVDVIYGGCIPVFLSDMTYYPYYDVLDYSKFSVFIEEDSIDHIEQILLSISDSMMTNMQTNLIRVRKAFVYNRRHHNISIQTSATPGSDEGVKFSPFYTHLSLAMRLQQIYPPQTSSTPKM